MAVLAVHGAWLPQKHLRTFGCREGSLEHRAGLPKGRTVEALATAFLPAKGWEAGGRNLQSRRRRNVVVIAGVRHGQELLAQGTVTALRAKEVEPFLSSRQQWKILDVRPIWERERAFVHGSLHVPLFIEDDDNSLLTMLKRQIQFGFGGWWLGQKLTKENESFLEDVASTSSTGKLVVTCGDGLRSLSAISKLHNAGYKELAWIYGGLNNARAGDFAQVDGDTLLQLATAGGVQGLLIKLAQYISNLQKQKTAA